MPKSKLVGKFTFGAARANGGATVTNRHAFLSKEYLVL